MQLIPDFKTGWKLYSVIAGLLLGLVNAGVLADFWGIQDYIGVEGLALLNAIVATVVIPGLRLIQQSPAVEPEVKAQLIEKAEQTPVKEHKF